MFVYSVCCLSAERRGANAQSHDRHGPGESVRQACRQRHARNVPRARRSLSSWLLPVVVAWCMPCTRPNTSSALYAARCAARYTTHCTRPLTHCRLNGRSPRRCCIGSARVCNKIGVINRAMAEDFDGEVHAVHHIQRTPSAGHGRIDAAASLTVAIPSHSAFAHPPQCGGCAAVRVSTTKRVVQRGTRLRLTGASRGVSPSSWSGASLRSKRIMSGAHCKPRNPVHRGSIRTAPRSSL